MLQSIDSTQLAAICGVQLAASAAQSSSQALPSCTAWVAETVSFGVHALPPQPAARQAPSIATRRRSLAACPPAGFALI